MTNAYLPVGESGYLGNLVLGGYDQSRFEPTNVTFSMPPSSGQTLLEVTVQGFEVGFDDGSSYSFTSDASQSTVSFNAILDSTLPYLYLPGNVCDNLERKLGLRRTKDDLGNEIYLFNVSSLTSLPEKIQITLHDTTTTSRSTTITLPFEALNLTASWPLFANGSHPYFPIRKSQGTNILGRAFFQEAYVIADYERHNFTVAQTTFPNPQPAPQLISIESSSFAPPPTSSKGLSGGAVAGVVIAVLAGLVAIGAWVFYAWKRKRKVRAAEEKAVLEANEKAREERERQFRRETASTFSSAGLSYEMDAGSRGERPRHSRQMSELSSDSEVERSRKPVRTPSAIYELPDSEAWHWNQRRLEAASRWQSSENQSVADRSPGEQARYFAASGYFPPADMPLTADYTPRGPSPLPQSSGIQPMPGQALEVPSPPIQTSESLFDQYHTPRGPSPYLQSHDINDSVEKTNLALSSRGASQVNILESELDEAEEQRRPELSSAPISEVTSSRISRATLDIPSKDTADKESQR